MVGWIAPLPRAEMRGRRRTGLGRVEVAAVLAAVALLGMMFTAYVQHVRSRSLMGGCSNMLRQSMLAMHNFHATFKKLPGERAKTIGRFSMWVEILPQLEQGALYDRLNFQCPSPTVLQIQTTGDRLAAPQEWLLGAFPETQPAGDRLGPHVAVMQNRLSMLTCRDDRDARNLWDVWNGGNAGIAVASISYCPVVTARGAVDASGKELRAVWEADDETTFPLQATLPAFADRVRMIGLDEISDGGQNTIGLVERIRGRLVSGRGDRRNQAVAGGADSAFVVQALGNFQSDNALTAVACGRSTTPDPVNDLSGALWLQHTCQWMGCANLMGPPNSVPCRGATPGANVASRGIAPPSSYHSGGANAAFFDGHVDFLSNETDLRVLHAWSTPNGGEGIPEIDPPF